MLVSTHSVCALISPITTCTSSSESSSESSLSSSAVLVASPAPLSRLTSYFATAMFLKNKTVVLSKLQRCCFQLISILCLNLKFYSCIFRILPEQLSLFHCLLVLLRWWVQMVLPRLTTVNLRWKQ